ncbi:MAG: glycosyltransferase family 2 protein [Candidatus Omnitrophota bacterium]|nr:glycosyltransferase family 2 protein [Candidatus Omnitrophota bacterium]
MMLVSVLIVTIGTKDYIQSCLDSLLEQTHLPFEIMVMDNSSQPDFARKLNSLYPSVKIYSSAENLFYTGALNKGIQLAQGEFILCLNDDVILDKDFIREALKGFLVKEKIGSVSGKILRGDRKTLDSAGLFLSAWRTAKERGYGRPDLGQFDKSGFIFGVSGSAAFYRKVMLEAIKKESGYFDKDFRMFYEDLDLSWRAQKCGWLAYYVPTALIYHVRGGSFRPDSGINKPRARRYLNDRLHCDLIKNRYLTILKNETFFSFLGHLIPIFIYDLHAWAYVVFFRPKVIKLFFGYFFAQINQSRHRQRLAKKRF